MDFIRSHVDRREKGGLRWGVEPICAVLSEHGVKIAPSTYHELVERPATASEYREAVLSNQIRDVHAANYSVFGARKMWIVLNRMGVSVARCTVERLMREAGLADAVRGKVKRTTIADRGAGRHPDLVQRRFTPTRPDQLWVADMTYVSRHASRPTRLLYSAGVLEAGSVTLFSAVNVLYFASVLPVSIGSLAIALSIAGFVGLLAPVPIGALADRFGSRNILSWSMLVEAGLLLSSCFVKSYALYILCVSLIVLCQRSVSATRPAMVADLFPRDQRVAAQSSLRSAMFLGAGIGALAGIWVVGIGTPDAFRIALATSSFLCVGSLLLVIRLPNPRRSAPIAESLASSVRAFRYIAVACISGVVGIHDSFLAISASFTVEANPSISSLVVPLVLLLSTVVTVLFQARIGRLVSNPRDAVRAHFVSALILCAGIGVLLIGATSGGLVGSVEVVTAGVLFAIAGMVHVCGAISLAYEMADDRYLASYLAVFSIGRGFQLTIGPVIVAGVVTNGSASQALLVGLLVFTACLIVGRLVRGFRFPEGQDALQ